ncbi:TolB-like translocation protein; signal peptide [Pilimelia anulata]|uniref:TolB-like translocation protein signal peptide n=1 Tax=Pilimelia anulata TaxID=53371 RepID=A0A8J3BEA4_9ACTN|nr:PD40 domain-containing protein [Pilimelia anulata]GGK07547.1 TolB-like translocation protein; signal peptide [Pilimelia anulata]
MTARRRTLLGIVLVTVTLVAGSGFAAARIRATDRPAGPALDPGRAGTLLYVDGATGRVQQAAGDRVTGTGPTCQRAYAAAGTLVCLRVDGTPGSTTILAYGPGMRERASLLAWGTPSRARVSPSGRLIAWTVFRSGDSYLNNGAFSTTAGAYDLATGAHYGSLEDFAVTIGGRPYDEVDMNFWGITFARDDRTFYATMSSKGRLWLLRGDLPGRRLVDVRAGVECPSLSPDGTRIAYKLRTGRHWRLHVLALGTGADVALAETAHVDDQPAWLDPATIGYARPHRGKPALFAVPADGTGAPRLLRPDAASPAAL